jgi:hypothetical protein
LAEIGRISDDNENVGASSYFEREAGAGPSACLMAKLEDANTSEAGIRVNPHSLKRAI